MRQVYETIIRALNADPNRLDDYSWHEIISTLTDCATPKERLYLHAELQKLRVVAAEVKLGALLLGERYEDGNDPQLEAGRNYQWSPNQAYPINSIPKKEYNPKQLELDL